MRAPIIADNFGDLLIFESKELAERYLEPIDVLNGEYVVYDAEGRLLRAEVEHGDRVAIRSAEPEPTHAEGLRQALIGFLSRVEGGGEASFAPLTLAALVARGLRYKTV